MKFRAKVIEICGKLISKCMPVYTLLSTTSDAPWFYQHPANSTSGDRNLPVTSGLTGALMSASFTHLHEQS
ncbi:hypothetical protein BH160DRAFT_2070 [Burkholderia sp. H160]|nr:hypothetical protein BH160DRAFT_2070 [Burkholderia sp. H160]